MSSVFVSASLIPFFPRLHLPIANLDKG